MMKGFSLQAKIAVPLIILFLSVVLGGAWFFVSTQNTAIETWYKEQMETMAVTSRSMFHSAAEEYAQSHGLQFHRVAWTGNAHSAVNTDVERNALKAFSSDPTRTSYSEKILRDGADHLFVFAPARLRSECQTCHAAYGVDVFEGKTEGELVAMFGVSGSLAAIESRATRVRLAAAFVALAVIGLGGWVLRRTLKINVSRPLDELVMQAEAVAEGNLRRIDTPFLERKLESNDEIGKLVRSFAKMINGLRSIIGNVHESSLAVANSSASILATAEQLSKGATEQSIQSHEAAAAVEEMSRTAAENSNNASLAANVAKQSKAVAEQGGIVVLQTVAGMKDIASVVNRSASTVRELGKSSEQIGEVISVIDGIADQTNLLALNATIEAARAGEQGRSFAVVADEVRRLAERTTTATKEISDTIKKIQIDTIGAVKAMEEGTEKVSAGIALADRAGTSLQEIVHVSQQVMDMVSQIAAASEQQSGASDQISKNVESISQVTKDTAAGTQQMAHAAEQLTTLTNQLQHMISNFQLDVLPTEEGRTATTVSHEVEAEAEEN